MYSTFKPEVEEIIMEDKLPSCINSWGTFVNNNHPLQTEEDAEPPSHLEGVFVFKDDGMFSISDSTSILLVSLFESSGLL